MDLFLFGRHLCVADFRLSWCFMNNIGRMINQADWTFNTDWYVPYITVLLLLTWCNFTFVSYVELSSTDVSKVQSHVRKFQVARFTRSKLNSRGVTSKSRENIRASQLPTFTYLI